MEERKPQDRKRSRKDDKKVIHLGGTKPSDPEHKQVRFSIWYFFAAVLLISSLHDLYSASQVQRLPYSEFKQAVASGEVARVSIENDLIRGEKKVSSPEGNTFVTIRVEDPGLVELLEQQGVSFEGRLENKWLPTLLSWIVPIGLLILFGRIDTGTPALGEE